uniref:Uncharacterized protein n=1 Tax=Ditylenchus dipsaci TaxID=166011 RepID=A0A915ECP8_9BILA
MTDLAFFQAFQQEHASHPPLLIRVNSLVKTREKTECALDEYDTWDFCIQNDGNQCLDKELNVISDYAKSRLFPQQ